MSKQFNKLFQTLFIVFSLVILVTGCNHEDNKINATCFDEVLNQEEVFIDCGGPNCDPCGPRCDDGVLDSVEGHIEYGIDCGGDCPTCCDNGVWDNENEDPAFNEAWVDCDNPSDPECIPCDECANGQHDAPAEMYTYLGVDEEAIDCDDDLTTDCPDCLDLCNDGLLNGLEELIDCGGVCLPCDYSSCENGILDEYNPDIDPNIDEMEIDCGGICVPCDDVLTLCFDGYLSGSEEAIDCGGICVPCADPILCGDGIQNGYEDDIDCYNGDNPAESSCPECNPPCDNGYYDGEETDTDCGGPECPPCAVIDERQNFMTYDVTTPYQNNVFYESRTATLTGTYVEGEIIDLPDPTPDVNLPDQLGFTGGQAHSVSFVIQDKDMIPMNWGEPNELIFDNIDVTLGYIDDVILIADENEDGEVITYYASLSPAGQGVTLNLTSNPSIQPWADQPNDFWEIRLVGEFSGNLRSIGGTGGEEATINNGVFDITFLAPIMP